MMEFIKIVFFTLPLLFLCLILKAWKPEWVIPLRMACIIALSAVLILFAKPVLSFFQSLTEAAGISAQAGVLWKGLGVAILGEICVNLCKESGEGALGDAVETAAKIELFLISLPLLESILAMAKELFSSF